MPSRRLVLSLAFVATLTAACADPPDREIQQAQTAIDAAKAAGADRYSPDEFNAAQEALKQAHDAVGQRDYRLALNHALDAREKAQDAVKLAADHKVTARGDADRAIAAMMQSMAEARSRLKTAENARAPARTLASARTTINAVEPAVQKARAAREGGDFLAAIDTAKDATSRLQGVSRDLEAAAPSSFRRRR
jgi:hypothetical protein